eukprot:tig00020684_g12905.t1
MASPAAPAGIADLPEELLVAVFRALPSNADRCRAMLTCKGWCALLREPDAWNDLSLCLSVMAWEGAKPFEEHAQGGPRGPPPMDARLIEAVLRQRRFASLRALHLRIHAADGSVANELLRLLPLVPGVEELQLSGGCFPASEFVGDVLAAARLSLPRLRRFSAPVRHKDLRPLSAPDSPLERVAWLEPTAAMLASDVLNLRGWFPRLAWASACLLDLDLDGLAALSALDADGVAAEKLTLVGVPEGEPAAALGRLLARGCASLSVFSRPGAVCDAGPLLGRLAAAAPSYPSVRRLLLPPSAASRASLPLLARLFPGAECFTTCLAPDGGAGPEDLVALVRALPRLQELCASRQGGSWAEGDVARLAAARSPPLRRVRLSDERRFYSHVPKPSGSSSEGNCKG